MRGRLHPRLRGRQPALAARGWQAPAPAPQLRPQRAGEAERVKISASLGKYFQVCCDGSAPSTTGRPRCPTGQRRPVCPEDVASKCVIVTIE